MRPNVRKVILILHISSAVGWLGATAAFLALALAGLSSHDDRLISSAYVAMNLVGWRVIVPLSLASLVTGLVQSLGSAWGLFRHYWVLLKFLITVVATGLLLLHMNLATRLSEIASGARLAPAHWHGIRLSMVADSAAAIALLTVNVTLSVFKPRGLTPYGHRKQRERINLGQANESGSNLEDVVGAPRWVKLLGITVLVVLVVFRVVLVHLSGGLGHHGH